MRSGLTLQLSVLLALIGILGSGLTGYYAYLANRNLMEGEAERNLQTSTDLLSRRFTEAVNGIAADAQTLAAMPSAPLVARGAAGSGPGRERLEQVFATFLRQHAEYLQVRLITRQEYGLERIRVERDGDRILRVDGGKLQEKGHLPYVFETLELPPGRTYVSPIAINHELGAHSAQGRPTLRLAAPIQGRGGKAVGVVVINADLARLLQAVQEDMPQNYRLYLANQWGDFLVHPDPARTFGFDKGRRYLMQDSFAQTRPLFESGAGTALMNGQGAPAGDASIISFERKPFGLPEERQFVVLGLSRPLDDVLSGGQQLGRSIAQMVLAFSVLAIALAALFARAMTRSLQMLAHAATRFSASHEMAALPLERGDEIGIVARCFAKMRLEIKAHMDMLYEQQRELHHLARHDALTGLPNRVQFFRQLELAVQQTPDGDRLAVLFVDLDCFKPVNDELGHAVGDQVLIVVARRLERLLRGSDMVARLGGDEFIVMVRALPDPGLLPGIAQGILQSLGEPMTIGAHRVRIGASIGISLYPCDGCSAEELVANADVAMYRAKAGGRASFAHYQGAAGAARES